MQHDDRALVHREATEGSVELVSVGDRFEIGVRDGGSVARPGPDDRQPATGAAGLGVAGTDSDPVDPGFEAGRIAELREVPSDGRERLLCGVFGCVAVAQDVERNAMDAIADREREPFERSVVAALCLDHEVGIHRTPPNRRLWPSAHRCRCR